ncbi:uncharacterized protein LOC133294585 isoform X2 [Gastrolobium bilobum]|uniref:uncharacterized protein LOC133294585 isoform X2 n=1 Tax=Gastrolobium bilobum TaxID=150636 RepID=UPI002AB05310|nr:uncharacterized protein LOC133294585 isoform X2 [Gastrolobium bilobum]
MKIVPCMQLKSVILKNGKVKEFVHHLTTVFLGRFVDLGCLASRRALIDVPKGELIMRVDGEQTIFKVLINEAPPLPASQPKNQVNYIAEKKVEEGNKKEIHQRHEEQKPNVKMEKPKSKKKHVKTKFKVPESPPPYPHEYEYNHSRTQILSKGMVSSLSPSYQPP